MERRCCGALPGLSSLRPYSSTKCPNMWKVLCRASALQKAQWRAMCRMVMFPELLRRQPLGTQLDTHRTIMNSHPVSKSFRQTTCQAGHMENRDLSSQKSHGSISYRSGNIVKWDRFGLGSPHLALNSCPASHTGIKGCAYCSSSLNPRIPPVLSTLTQVMHLSEPISPRLLKYQCHF